MSTRPCRSTHASIAVLSALLCVSLSVAGREYTEAQFKTYTDFGSYGGFEGAQITVMRGGDKTYLVKPFIAAQECTNDGGDCFIQPPFFIYDYDPNDEGFVDVSALITNPDEYLIPHTGSNLAGDFNGDGRDDLIFAITAEFFAPPGKNYSGWRWENFILLSNDDGAFTWRPLHEFKGVSSGISAGDIDGDGDLDLFIDDAGDPDDMDAYKWPDDWGGYFLINDGKGEFVRSSKRWPSNSRSALADLDGDGDLDLALLVINKSCQPHLPACRIFNGIYVYQNDGSGAFTEVAGDIPFTSQHSFDRDENWVVKHFGTEMEKISLRSVVALDANNDGLLDLAVSVEENVGDTINLTSVLINEGNFDFSKELDRFPHVTPKSFSNRLRAIDADQDGFTDLYFEKKLVARTEIFNPISESIYFNDGKGFFSNNNRLGLPDDFGILTVADVNSDRVYDFISTWGYQHTFESEVSRSRTTTVFFSDPESIIVPPSATTLFNQLLDTVLSTTQTSDGGSAMDRIGSMPPQARAGDKNETEAIPTLPTFVLLILSGLIGLFGIRRFVR